MLKALAAVMQDVAVVGFGKRNGLVVGWVGLAIVTEVG
jgi:uncharacterized membrane protein